MKAARFHGPGDIRIDEVPDPALGPGQVEVTIDWCGICGGVDVAFECAGIDSVLAGAISSVRPRGTVVNVAIWGHVPSVPVNELVFSEVSVVGSLAYCGDHADTIALLRDGKVDATAFVTGRIGLDDLVDGGFRELIDNKEENVKILVSPRGVDR